MTDYKCNARKKRCSNCGHKFSRDEYDLWECPECGADRHCKNAVPIEGQRCRMHGGRSPSGVASPSYKHGRYSKVIPSNLAERYQESLIDQELLAMRDEIALIDSRLGDLIDSLEVGSTGKLWEKLREVYTNMRMAVAERDIDRMAIALHEIGAVIDLGAEESKSWIEIYALIEQRRRLVESEAKRLIQMQQVITTEQAMVMLSRIQQAVLENVTDKRALVNIAAALRELVSLPASK